MNPVATGLEAVSDGSGNTIVRADAITVVYHVTTDTDCVDSGW